MGLRFRKSFKLAPGLRWNLSGTGSSFSFGPRGATVSVGKRGVYGNVGIPGTGLSLGQRLDEGNSARVQSFVPPPTQTSLTCSVEDDGSLRFRGADGQPAPDALVEVAKKQNRQALVDLIQRACDKVNDQVDVLGRLHHDTPSCQTRPRFEPGRYPLAQPQRPARRVPGFVEGLFKKNRLRIEEENDAALARYEDELEAWEDGRRAFDASETKRRVVVEKLIYEDAQAMEDFLEENLQNIAWPRETLVSVDILDRGLTVMLDVDLPEIEDMPSKVASVPARGLKLSVKEMAVGRRRRLYLEHVHGILFRLVGEAFAALPVATTVIAAGYSQRADKATGRLADDYLLSVRVERPAWQEVDFSRLDQVDVVESLAQHELRRDMLKSGELRAVVPHAAPTTTAAAA